MADAYLASGQIATSTSAAAAVGQHDKRKSVTIYNTDATITVYLGPSGVTSATGLPLKAGASISVDTAGPIYVVAASGTPTVAYLETDS